jgi:GMP synthase-like glutamine amidotransferase
MASNSDTTRKRVCYISQLLEEGTREHFVTTASAEGGDDGDWLARRLSERGLRHMYSVTTVNLVAGDALPPPTDNDFDYFVIGGTFLSVYDGRPWQGELRSWLLAHRSTGKPLLGICGGHQVMCVALGGAVTKRPSGTALGCLPVTLTPAGEGHYLMADAALSLEASTFYFGNGDEVSALPEEATVLATTGDSPAVALDYGQGWCSVQFHPEASSSFFQHLVNEGVVGTPEPGVQFRELRSGAALLDNFLKGWHGASIQKKEGASAAEEASDVARQAPDGADAARQAHAQHKGASTLVPGHGVVEALAAKFGVPLGVAAAIFQAGVERGEAGARASTSPAGGGAAAAGAVGAAVGAATGEEAVVAGAAAAGAAVEPSLGFAFSGGVSLEDLRRQQARFARARDW